METVNVKTADLSKLIVDVAQIKEMLLEEKEEKEMEELELTDWAEKELEEARNRSEKEYVSLEDVKKKILSKK
tara:strand:+ start:142 stop:360 length:219 start_codon:yes stop_codon:yes gene_type:complete